MKFLNEKMIHKNWHRKWSKLFGLVCKCSICCTPRLSHIRAMMQFSGRKGLIYDMSSKQKIDTDSSTTVKLVRIFNSL